MCIFCVSMCLYVGLNAGAEYAQERGVEFSGSWGAGICDPMTNKC